MSMRSISSSEPYRSQYMQRVSTDQLIVTSQNEVLSKSKVYGKIGKVGVGFGTGRHTAHVHDHGT